MAYTCNTSGSWHLLRWPAAIKWDHPGSLTLFIFQLCCPSVLVASWLQIAATSPGIMSFHQYDKQERKCSCLLLLRLKEKCQVSMMSHWPEPSHIPLLDLTTNGRKWSYYKWPIPIMTHSLGMRPIRILHCLKSDLCPLHNHVSLNRKEKDNDPWVGN